MSEVIIYNQFAMEYMPEVPTPVGISYDRVNTNGQSTSYRVGDAGWHFQNGTFNYVEPVYPLNYAKLDYTTADILTLLDNNDGGNKNRFVDSIGGQTYTNGYIRDNLTNLGWCRDLIAADNWNNQIDNSLTSTVCGYSDWRLPTLNELLSVITYEYLQRLNYAPFNISSDILWTSNSASDVNRLSFAVTVFTSNGIISRSSKTTGNLKTMLVRNHI